MSCAPDLIGLMTIGFTNINMCKENKVGALLI